MAEGTPAGLAAARLLRTNWLVAEDKPGVTGPKMSGKVSRQSINMDILTWRLNELWDNHQVNIVATLQHKF